MSDWYVQLVIRETGEHDGPCDLPIPDSLLCATSTRLALSRLVREGATDAEINSGLVHFELTIPEKRLHESILRELRSAGGPPTGDGLSVDEIRTRLRQWDGPWPPTQDQLTDYSSRRLRQVLTDARTTWRDEVTAADRDRAETGSR